MPAQGSKTILVLVVASGVRADVAVRRRLPAAQAVVGADGGVDGAHALGLRVDVAVGDFDSVSAAGLARAEAEGARLVRHRPDKDFTDLELALDEAVALGATSIVVVGDDGGRLDHLLAGALLLAAPRYEAVAVTALLGPATLHVVRPGRPVELTGTPGDLVSLVPVHGGAQGVRTRGLAYPLHGEPLLPGTSRGVSNVLLAEPAAVEIAAGVLVAVLPGVTDPNQPTLGGPNP